VGRAVIHFDISEHLATLYLKIADIEYEDCFLPLSHLLNTVGFFSLDEEFCKLLTYPLSPTAI